MRKTASPKKRRIGRIVFCAVYLVVFTVFGLCLHRGLQWLDGWLTDYEAAQPNVKSEEVFQSLFRQPDWEALYVMAGVEDTQFESAAHYAAHMAEKVGQTPLTYYETSAGLSGNHKYFVKLGDEKIAEYVLTANDHAVTDIPDWQLGGVELFFDRQQSVTVCTPVDATVYVNGVALSRDHIIATMDTAAEAYLPEDVHGLRRCWWQVDSLLEMPLVTAVSAQEDPLELVYDAATGAYTVPVPEQSMPQAEQERVVEAAKTYCLYMVRAISRNGLYKFYDRDSEISRVIGQSQTGLQEHKGFYFGEPALSDYYRYSDTLFSVRLTMSMYVQRLSGEDKEYPLDSTFVLEKQENDTWMVVNMVNTDLQEQTTLVRLRYMLDGAPVEDQMVATTATSLTPPQIAVPEGKVFAGWYRQEKAPNGNITYSLAFSPDENGTIYLSEPLGWNPMTLYALFENK